MDREKEIEEMAQVFCGGEERGYACDCGDWCCAYYEAHRLVDAGYGNVKGMKLRIQDLEADNKRLRNVNAQMQEKYEELGGRIMTAEQAVKEFAEKLKKKLSDNSIEDGFDYDYLDYSGTIQTIDELLKEYVND